MIRFDESIVPATAPADLHYSLTDRFLRADVVDKPPPSADDDSGTAVEDTLRKLRLVADDANGGARLTLA